MRSYSKNELARAAGVSYRTFQRWLQQNRAILSEMGVMPRTKLIPARAAQWICGQYGIDEKEPHQRTGAPKRKMKTCIRVCLDIFILHILYNNTII